MKRVGREKEWKTEFEKGMMEVFGGRGGDRGQGRGGKEDGKVKA